MTSEEKLKEDDKSDIKPEQEEGKKSTKEDVKESTKNTKQDKEPQPSKEERYA